MNLQWLDMTNKEEKWKFVQGYDKDYAISNFGRVKSYKRNKPIIMSPSDNGVGYQMVRLSDGDIVKTHLIHRLVAIAFIDNPNNKSEVNHINGDKTDNNKSNLEWVTAKENTKHAHESGIYDNSGDKHYNAKLSWPDVINIRTLYHLSDYTQRELSELYNVHEMTISDIIREKAWKRQKPNYC